jgi:neutral amino acid transport system permease protein
VAKRPVALMALLVFFLLPVAFAQAAQATTQAAPKPSSVASMVVAAEPTEDASPTDEASPSEEPTAPAAPPDGPYLSVRLLDNTDAAAGEQGEPVPGVTMVVTDEAGGAVGEAPTAENGIALIEIPGSGTYTVELDEETLPDGIALDEETGNTREVRAPLDGPNIVVYSIGTMEADTAGFAYQLSAALVSGLKFGLITALAALGLSLIFGTTGLTNFSHGELITFGGIMTWVFNVGLGMPVIPAGVAAVAAAALFGWAQERALWRPLRRRGTGLIAMMIVSIGFALFLRFSFQFSFGPQTKSLSQYTTQARQEYGPIAIADKEIAIILIALVVIAVTVLALTKTRLGKAMRAVSDNPPLAASSGMRVDGVVAAAWILGTALTGLSGVLLAVNSQVNFLMGFRLLLLVFAAVTLGGLGTIWGALLGSMIIGFMVEVGPLFGVPASIKEVGALVVLILVLLVRPQGILGRRQRIG